MMFNDEQRELAAELDRKYDSGIGTFALPEDDVNGMVSILKLADVDFEVVPELESIYFNYPESEGNDDGE